METVSSCGVNVILFFDCVLKQIQVLPISRCMNQSIKQYSSNGLGIARN
jgi:hypothetical protein